MYADDSVIFLAVVYQNPPCMVVQNQENAEKRHLVNEHWVRRKMTDGRVYQKLHVVLESDGGVCPTYYGDHMHSFSPAATKMLKQTHVYAEREMI